MKDLFDLSGLDEQALSLTQEAREETHRAIVVQGDYKFENDPKNRGTVHHTGGIGFKTDSVSEAIVNASDGVVTLPSGPYAVFQTLPAVILASARVRRLIVPVDGQDTTVCGTNQDGYGATGWSGNVCKECPFKQDKTCKASVALFLYFPSIDHAAIMQAKGWSYMPAANWLEQVTSASVEFAKTPEVRSRAPHLKRVNSYFFTTQIKTCDGWMDGPEGNKLKTLDFVKYSRPYQWPEILTPAEARQKCVDVLKDSLPLWENRYKEENLANVKFFPGPIHNPAVLALPGAVPLAQLPPETKAVLAAETPVVASAAPLPAAVVAAQAKTSMVTLDEGADMVPF